MRGNRFFGIIVIIIGLSILLNVLGIDVFIGPIILFAIGAMFYTRHHHWLGLLFFGLSAIVFFNEVFDIDIGGLVVALAFIYFGYRLLNGKKDRSKPKPKKKQKPVDDEKDDEEDWIDREIEKLEKAEEKSEKKFDKDALKTKLKQEKENVKQTLEKERDRLKEKTKEHVQVEVDHDTVTLKTPKFRSNLIGDFSLMNQRFELDDMNVSHGIGDVKIDLSKAIISEGETNLHLKSFIGDVDIYVPYDLDVAVDASVTIGDLDVLGYQQGGINRHISLATKGYKESTRKVKITISSLIGDIDVRHL